MTTRKNRGVTPLSLKNKHEDAGHDVTVDANGGVLFCRTCGHHILSNAQINAGTLCDFLDLVLMGNSEFDTLEKTAEAIMHSIDPTRYVTIGDK